MATDKIGNDQPTQPNLDQKKNSTLRKSISANETAAVNRDANTFNQINNHRQDGCKISRGDATDATGVIFRAPTFIKPTKFTTKSYRTHPSSPRERERGGGGKRKPEAHLHIRKQAGRLEAIDSLQIVVIGRPDVLISEIQLDTEADENNFIVRCTISSSSSSSSSSSFISFHSCSLLASLCCFFLRCSAYYFLGIALQLVVIGPVKKQHIWLRKGGVSGSAGGDSSASDSR